MIYAIAEVVMGASALAGLTVLRARRQWREDDAWFGDIWEEYEEERSA